MYIMKSSIIHYLVATIALYSSSSSSSSSSFAAAFVHPRRAAASTASSSAALRMSKRLVVTPDIEAAIADVRAAASEFGEETAYFANGELRPDMLRVGG
jgi:uncharacterized protein involved in copper resistance